MCIVTFAWRVLKQTPLFLVSNRDEFYHRPTQSLTYQNDLDFFAGRDLQSGGTWLGATQTGRWAIILNYRDALDQRTFNTSRGHIVQQYLQSDSSPLQFAQQLQQVQQQYAGFNLILGNQQQAIYMSNRGQAPQILSAGVYSVSNGLMSAHWAKATHLQQRFSQEVLTLLNNKLGDKLDDKLDNNPSDTILNNKIIHQCWQILQDTQQQADELLPNTGVSYEWEKLLSSTFIQSKQYGTRCSNILMMNIHAIHWLEKTQHGELAGQIRTLHIDLIE